jgi:hypothetical protein
MTLYETENCYLLCTEHLLKWREGGNNVKAYPRKPSEYLSDYVCIDCQEQA